MDKKEQPPPYYEQPQPYGNPHIQQPQPYAPHIQQPQPYAVPHMQQPQPYMQQPQPYMPQPQPYIQHPQPYAVPQPVQPSTNLNVTVNTGGRIGTGSCPICQTGRFENSFTCCGWLCCICFFPIGILCCLCMQEKKCNHCGYTVS